MLETRVEDLIDDYIEHYEVNRNEAVSMMIADLDDAREEEPPEPQVKVQNTCVACGATIEVEADASLANIVKGAKQAVCSVCNHRSGWKRV